MKKTVYVVNVDNYAPDLCEFTFPNLKAYASRIGAEFKLITERKFPDFPAPYEKMQVYELGKDDDYSIILDADVLLKSDFPDLTEVVPFDRVGSYMMFPPETLFPPDEYFTRDGRRIGVATNVLVVPRMCHDVLTPLDMPASDVLPTLKRQFIVDEYCVSRNLAKFGIKYCGVIDGRTADSLLHLNYTTDKKDNLLQTGKDWLAGKKSASFPWEHQKPKLQIATRNELPSLLNKKGLVGVGVEVGVLTGDYSKHLLTFWKGKKLFMVDTWRKMPGRFAKIPTSTNPAEVEADELRNQLNNMAEAARNVYKFDSRAVLIRETSIQAANLFPDGCLDFVYLDADHSYQAVMNDIQVWWPKVKAGGILCGDDYIDGATEFGVFGVKQAVTEFSESLKLQVTTFSGAKNPNWAVEK